MSGPAVSARPARSYKAATDILSERDPVLRQLVARAGPVRVNPPTETRFAALVRAILYQRLAGAAARAIHGRLIASLGGEVTRNGSCRFLANAAGRGPVRQQGGVHADWAAWGSSGCCADRRPPLSASASRGASSSGLICPSATW
jgi:hypothetical protein